MTAQIHDISERFNDYVVVNIAISDLHETALSNRITDLKQIIPHYEEVHSMISTLKDKVNIGELPNNYNVLIEDASYRLADVAKTQIVNLAARIAVNLHNYIEEQEKFREISRLLEEGARVA